MLGEETVFEPTGETVQTDGIIQVRILNGEITGWGAFWDKFEMFQQGEIVPPLKDLAE